jgi:hypothetical protein
VIKKKEVSKNSPKYTLKEKKKEKKPQTITPSVPSRKQNSKKKGFQINPQRCLPKKNCQKQVPKKVDQVYP